MKKNCAVCYHDFEGDEGNKREEVHCQGDDCECTIVGICQKYCNCDPQKCKRRFFKHLHIKKLLIEILGALVVSAEEIVCTSSAPAIRSTVSAIPISAMDVLIRTNVKRETVVPIIKFISDSRG